MSVDNWSCPNCTLINNIQEHCCKACLYSFNKNNRNGFLRKLKLPHFSVNSALEKLDSALDLITNSPGRSSTSQQNVQIYPQFNHSPAIWKCSSCSQLNNHSGKRCVWCNLARETDATYNYWTCSNPNCCLKQPLTPLNGKCPLCRVKSSYHRMQTSKSMPRLSDIGLVENVLSLPQGESDDKIAHSDRYNSITEHCRLTNHCFLDDSFPHSLHSIGPLSQFECKNLDIIWLRPSEIFTRDGHLVRWAVFNDPQPTDIEQGLLGNCWFLSAMAVVSERPDILERLFLSKVYDHYGVYEMRLCVDGLWQNVFVDDFFPCHKRSRTMVFGVGRKNQLWPSLLEKALAKIYGNYAILRAGRICEGLSTLTGAPTISLDLEYIDLNFEGRMSALNIVWAKLLSAREARFIMGCSCGAGNRPVNEDEYKKLGLMSQHAYSLLDVRQTREGYRLVQLRNPWGSFVWNGEFSRKWPGWTSELKKELASDANKQSGTFWMPFERLANYFDTIDIAQINRGWISTRHLLDIGWVEGRTRIVRFTITEPTELCVILHQRNARTVIDQVDILVTIHKQEMNKDGFPGELICRSPRKIGPIVRTEDSFFQPGEYLIFAHSFSNFGEMIPGTVVIHSSKKIFSESLTSSLEVLRSSICFLMLKEGSINGDSNGMIARYLTNNFAGLALMVDNTNPNTCVQVRSDFNNSTNVLSTRGSLFAVDSLPPLHRQIIIVLTHAEASQPLSVAHSLCSRSTSFPQLKDWSPSTNYFHSQNLPLLIGESIGILHGPMPLYI
uniref:Uncharacterized protein n=1 Tax=Meloidogyne enterolobii TaxID=390850 RepID=A0A6V7UQS5_MELEN|nr:unnamed protein product [Meloidogyne enterolobii]